MSNGVFNFNFVALVFSEILGVPNLHQGALRPLDAPQWKIFFVFKASTSQYLIVFLISKFQLQQFPRFQRGPKFTLGGPVPPCTPPSGQCFVPEVSTLLRLMVFLNSTFQLFYFPRYQGGPKFTLGGHTPPGRPQRRNFCTPSEYVTISNCVFNFNILALVLSGILGGSQIYIRGPCAPQRPPSVKILKRAALTPLNPQLPRGACWVLWST